MLILFSFFFFVLLLKGVYFFLFILWFVVFVELLWNKLLNDGVYDVGSVLCLDFSVEIIDFLGFSMFFMMLGGLCDMWKNVYVMKVIIRMEVWYVE